MPHETIQEKLIKAVQHQATGDYLKAQALFLQIVEVEPTNFAALYSLAAISANTGHHAAALAYANHAILIQPQFANTYFVRSIANFHLNKFLLALADIDKALTLDPELPNANNHRALVLAHMNDPDTLNQQQTIGKLTQEALVLQGQGQFEEAYRAFNKILEIDENNFAALYSLGVLEGQQGQKEKSLNYFTKVVESEPQSALGQFALATAQQNMGLFESALESFDRSLALDPNYLAAYSNKTSLLHSMNRHLDAINTADAALKISPEDPASLCNKGYLLTEFKQFSAASEHFKKLLQVNPDFDYAEGLHAYSRLHSCDWTDYELNRQRVLAGVRAGKHVCNPLVFMALSDSAADAKKCAVDFGIHRYPAAKEPLWRGRKYHHRKKRVAFISSDFREHPVGYLLIGMIENMHKAHIETIGISLGVRDKSELYKRYRNGFDHYLDCSDKTSVEIANLLHSLEVDIAIDLSGYTAGTRLDILSYRPAPVQMTYLGFPGTLGLPYVDYIIADKVIIPEESQIHYTEKVLYLPHCYLPRDTSVLPAVNTMSRSELGLPDSGTLFCSFNHDYKINPPMFKIWMELLNEVPKSILWLMSLNDDARQNLSKYATEAGIDPARLAFATRVPRVEDHLARYRHVDVFLDTFPYNGHTTAGDALLAGTPLVTMAGQSFASRVASSLLTDVNQNTLYSTSQLSEYKEMALKALGEKEKFKINEWPNDSMKQSQALENIVLSATILTY